MLLKCPKCRNRSVIEDQIEIATWKRSCVECFFVYTIKAEPCDDSLEMDSELLEAVARDYQLELL